jgi:Transposase
VEQEGPRVVVGMDPHKRSVTIEVMDAEENVLGGGRFGTELTGYRSMLDYLKRWPDRVWAIEGCSGIGRHIAMRLLADGQEIVDVPPKLSARARVFSTGQGRKTDATDAHSVALVGTRMSGLRPVIDDEQLAVLRVLVDRRRSLGEDHTRMISQLHALLLELIPGGAKKDLSAAQAKALLAKVRPRDAASKARRRVAAELIGDLERIYQRRKTADKELTELVAATGTSLMKLQRHRSLRCRPAAGRSRRHHPIPRPRPLRVLERHRTHRRIIRRPGPAPAVPGRQPADQPDHPHHGHRPTAQPNRGTCLLRPPQSRREDLHGSHARPEETAVQHRLPRHARRRDHSHRDPFEDGPGRANGTRL